MPLSGIALCEAEMTTPNVAPVAFTAWAMPGVGRTPTSWTSTPVDAMPAEVEAARNSPLTRVSRPTIATGQIGRASCRESVERAVHAVAVRQTTGEVYQNA